MTDERENLKEKILARLHRYGPPVIEFKKHAAPFGPWVVQGKGAPIYFFDIESDAKKFINGDWRISENGIGVFND